MAAFPLTMGYVCRKIRGLTMSAPPDRSSQHQQPTRQAITEIRKRAYFWVKLGAGSSEIGSCRFYWIFMMTSGIWSDCINLRRKVSFAGAEAINLVFLLRQKLCRKHYLTILLLWEIAWKYAKSHHLSKFCRSFFRGRLESCICLWRWEPVD